MTFLHVLEGQPPASAADSPSPLHAVEQFSRDSRQWAGQQLHRAVSDQAPSWCEVEERVKTGRAYARILELADDERSDLSAGLRTGALEPPLRAQSRRAVRLHHQTEGLRAVS